MALLNRRDTIQMMQTARREILDLRRVVDELAPKAHAYDQLSTVLGLLPKPSRAYGEDVAQRLERQIAEEEAAIQAEKDRADIERAMKS